MGEFEKFVVHGPLSKLVLQVSIFTTLLFFGFSLWRFISLSQFQEDLEKDSEKEGDDGALRDVFYDVYTNAAAVYSFAGLSLLVVLAMLVCLGGALRRGDPSLLRWALIGNCGCGISSGLAIVGLTQVAKGNGANQLDIASVLIYSVLGMGFLTSSALIRLVRQDPAFDLTVYSNNPGSFRTTKVQVSFREERGNETVEDDIPYAEPAY